MAIGNIGAILLEQAISVIVFIVWLFVIFAVFRIRNATERTANDLEQVIHKMKSHPKRY